MKIIANPRAGHGAGVRGLEALGEAARRRGDRIEILATERPGHATRLARRLAGSEPRIGVLGGDGTLSEVAEGVVGSGVEVALLPMGTGNDTARSLGIPRGLDDALELAMTGEARPFDLGHETDRHFVSVLGVGFPAVVADEANGFTWLRGSAAFFVAIVKTVGRLRALPLTIVLDDETLEMDAVAVLVLNTPYTGGGLMMAPEAETDDGRLDVVIVEDIGKLDLMINFPKAYRGRHFEHSSFTVHRTRTVRIEAEESLPKMYDGDLNGATTPLEADVIPGGLRVVTPGVRGGA